MGCSCTSGWMTPLLLLIDTRLRNAERGGESERRGRRGARRGAGGRARRGEERREDRGKEG
eukprot:2779338-Rhodomonas_salina.2